MLERRGDRRRAHVRLQLPLRARGPARARPARGRRARRHPPLPRHLPAVVGRRPDARTSGASTRRRPAAARWVTSRRTSSTSPATWSATSSRSPPRSATFVPGREVDDAVAAAVRFANGAIGTIEATRFATGEANRFTWEVNGSKGSLAFDLERPGELILDGRRVLLRPRGLVARRARRSAGSTPSSSSSITSSTPWPAAATVAPHGATFADGVARGARSLRHR